MRVPGSRSSPRIPGAPVHRISFSAPSAAPSAAATVSALMLSSVPAASADSGLTTGIRPLSRSFFSTVVSTASMSPTKPKSTGLGFAGDLQRRAAPGADEAGVDAADPDRIDVEVAAHAEHARVDEPVEHHGGHVDRAAASVTRRPSTMRVVTPSAADTSVSCGPPPCTSTTRTPK